MRILGLIMVLLWGTVAAVSATGIDTVRFDSDQLLINSLDRAISVTGCQMISVAGKPDVPVKQVFYGANHKTVGRWLAAQVLSADTVELGFAVSTSGPDQITSDDPIQVDYEATLRAMNGLYPAAGYQTEVYGNRDATHWSVSIFPVQFLDDNRIVFNREIEVFDFGIDASVHVERRDNSGFGSMMAEKTGKNGSMALAGANGCPLGTQFVIVTSPELVDACTGLAQLKRRTGFDAAVAVTDSIFTYYAGIDNAEALRNYLHDFYDAGGVYVLLAGDEDNVPVRYAYYYNTSTVPDLYNTMICDSYFADFDGDWDFDGDGVWGEPTQDHPDIGPEVLLGRLPFGSPEQVEAYTVKLENYVFNPGNGDFSYLDRATFITSDQMLDYLEIGQQNMVAESFPASFTADCVGLSEHPSGNDPAPTGPTAVETMSELDNGFGMINILAHGRPDGFVLNSSEYNLYPKTYMLTGEGHVTNAAFRSLPRNMKSAFYYSIACDQAAIDLETLYGIPVPSMTEELLGLDSAGAIGLIGFSRWGWVASSYKFMTSFYAHLFGDAQGNPVAAMYASWVDYPYYRDQIYGQNYFGDPSLTLYRSQPSQVSMQAPSVYDPFRTVTCTVSLDGSPMAYHPVVVTIDGDYYDMYYSDGNGVAEILLPSGCTGEVVVTAVSDGAVAAATKIEPSISADADDDKPLPGTFELHQNYPNPFNPTTTIAFDLGRSGYVTMVIYDVLGRVVATPVDGHLTAGSHQVIWDATDGEGHSVASGIYFYRLQSEEGVENRKMVLIR